MSKLIAIAVLSLLVLTIGSPVLAGGEAGVEGLSQSIVDESGSMLTSLELASSDEPYDQWRPDVRN
jgi:hypothetical protein